MQYRLSLVTRKPNPIVTRSHSPPQHFFQFHRSHSCHLVLILLRILYGKSVFGLVFFGRELYTATVD